MSNKVAVDVFESESERERERERERESLIVLAPLALTPSVSPPRGGGKM